MKWLRSGLGKLGVGQLAIDRLDPGNSALVVIDVQNDFCSPRGVMAKSGKDVSGAVAMIPRLERLIEGAHQSNVPVILVRTIHSPETTSQAWRYRTGRAEQVPNCVPGSWGAEFFELKPAPDDFIVTKHRYSAFNSPEFIELLARLKRSSLLFCGVATNVCVETSLRDATCSDYYSTLVEDCSSAYLKSLHDGTVHNVMSNFGQVVTVDEILVRWLGIPSNSLS